MAATTPSSYTMLREPDPRVEFYHTETPVPGTKTTFAVWAPKARQPHSSHAASHRAFPSPPLRRRQRTGRESCPCCCSRAGTATAATATRPSWSASPLKAVAAVPGRPCTAVRLTSVLRLGFLVIAPDRSDDQQCGALGILGFRRQTYFSRCIPSACLLELQQLPRLGFLNFVSCSAVTTDGSNLALTLSYAKDDQNQWMERADLSKVAMAGFSMGAAEAINAQARLPSETKALLLLSPSILVPAANVRHSRDALRCVYPRSSHPWPSPPYNGLDAATASSWELCLSSHPRPRPRPYIAWN